jgi:PAS domain S-box-containing protein
VPGILDFFTRDEFLPHAYCLVENPNLIRLHISSDAITALAYYSIPLALVHFSYKRREDIPFSWMFILFAAFILLCGTTHLFGIWTLYVPDYYSQGVLKAATGLASIGTAIVVWRLMPALLLLPGPEKLRKLNHELESLVDARTSELQAALAEKESLLRQAYHRAAIVTSSDDAIIALDLEGTVTEWNPAAERLLGWTAQEMMGRRLRNRGAPAFPLADHFLALLDAVRERELVHQADTRWEHKSGSQVDASVKASPIREPSGGMQGVSVIARDIRERLRDAERMRTMMMEIDHRAKNMLAVVLAMIRMTRREPACDSFVETIQGRVSALAASHTAIVEHRWDGALLSTVIQRTLQPFVAEQKIAVEGEEVFMAPTAVQAVGLVLHELATNALKYGSLSVPAGGVLIKSTRLETGDLRIVWVERGGPPVVRPRKVSFGMKLITRNIPDQLGGATEVRWEEDGVRATLTIPRTYVVEGGIAGPHPAGGNAGD